jgi:hypothetical protein
MYCKRQIKSTFTVILYEMFDSQKTADKSDFLLSTLVERMEANVFTCNNFIPQKNQTIIT